MNNNNHRTWIITVFLITFVLAIIFSFLSNAIAIKLNNYFLSFSLLLTIAIGVIFDMIGTSTISARESTFHSLNSKKVRGASEAIIMIKNADKVSSICNDIVGDVCGIISGSLGAFLAISLATEVNATIISIVISSVISALTVGGKAIFKQVAIKHANEILMRVSKTLSIFF